jgi:hypothetical protein
MGGSGGSTGKPSRTKMDLDHVAQCAKQWALGYSVHGIFHDPLMIWSGGLPDSTSIIYVLSRAHVGCNIEHWFSPLRGNDANMGWYYTLLTYFMIFMARFHGLKFPLPQYIPLNAPLSIAQKLAEVAQKNNITCKTATSKCVRISVAAQQHNIDLTGVTFYGTSEPATPAKVATIKSSGANFISHYSSTEAGEIGLACANPADVSDVHFLKNNLAMIQRPQEVFDQTVNALHFTTLLPSNPKMMLNVQSDDFGIVEERDCGCPLYQMGLTQHLRQISSFRKLTGGGVTLVGSDMVHILEHVLPSQFGGSLFDYQLVEEETEDGFTKLLLYVDPSVTINDEYALGLNIK